eukprot:COSAG01_NODE_841_length_13175_cov_26.426124_16_plen_367_part_00
MPPSGAATTPHGSTRTYGRGLRVIHSYRHQSDSEPIEPEELAQALRMMVEGGLCEYDTARSYGKEPLLGAALRRLPLAISARIAISSKASPKMPDVGSRGGFTRSRMLQQAEASRAELGRDSVYVLYLHNPDLVTDLNETLAAVDELWKQGFFAEFGLSNFPAWQVMQIYDLCRQHGFSFQPRVYQGCYSPLARQCEAEIIPCCKMLGMRFNCYSPWAAGMLQQPWADGSSSELRGPERGRYYGGSAPTVGLNGSGSGAASDGFAAVAVPAALRRIDGACRAAGISIAHATARWHFYHSALGAGDGVIMGSAFLAQLRDNIALVEAAGASGPLPKPVLAAFENAWKIDLAGPAEYPAMGFSPVAKL